MLCIDCKKRIWKYSIRCKSCAHKGSLGSSWKGGNDRLPNCMDCGKKLSAMHCKRCSRCSKIENGTKFAIESDLSKDPSKSGITITKVSLIKTASNSYTGFVDYQYEDVSDREDITVNTDSSSLIYNSNAPKAILVRKLQEELITA